MTTISSTLQDRILGMILGALIADAGAQPIHWIYDVPKLHSQLTAAEHLATPEFQQPSLNPFYSIPTGKQTISGDQLYVLLRSIALHKKFNAIDYAKESFQFFGNQGDGGYGPWPCDQVPRDQLPQQKPWRTASIRLFLTAILDANIVDSDDSTNKWIFSGTPDEQADSYAKVSPLVALYAISRALQSSPPSSSSSSLREFDHDIGVASSVTQTGPLANGCAKLAGRILLQILEADDVSTCAIRQIIERVANDIDRTDEHAVAISSGIIDILARSDQPHAMVVKELGLGCGVPFSFYNAIHSIVSVSEVDNIEATNWYTQAIRQTLLSGGDSASRSCFIGAVIGAAIGASNLPQDWIAKTLFASEAQSAIQSLISALTAQ